MRALRNRYLRFLLNRICPKWIFNNLHRWPEDSFFWTTKKISFTLSFDCDNPEDHQCLPWLLSLLEKHQITASFAVSGEVVSKNIEAYKTLVDSGHEIINHGYSIHLYSDEKGQKHPSMFYETLGTDEIVNEIEKNDQFLKRKLGIKPIGFRTPHFGTFQNRDQLTFLHKIIKEKGYKYSSSSTIFEAKSNNFVGMSKNGIWEFPLSAIPKFPLSTFDSWALLASPDTKFQKEDFTNLFGLMVGYALKSRKPVFLNVYFDPIHIMGYNVLEMMLKTLTEQRNKIWIGTYQEIVATSQIR